MQAVKVYKKANGDYNSAGSNAYAPSSKKIQDTEIYDDDNMATDPTLYFDASKAEFVDKMEHAYKEYNTLKTDYIMSTYSRDNDDLVDTKTFYKKNDDYSYAKQDA